MLRTVCIRSEQKQKLQMSLMRMIGNSQHEDLHSLPRVGAGHREREDFLLKRFDSGFNEAILSIIPN